MQTMTVEDVPVGDRTGTERTTTERSASVFDGVSVPWVQASEFPVHDPQDFDAAAYDGDRYELTDPDAMIEGSGAGRLGPLADVVRSLRFALEVVREQFETVVDGSGHRAVAAADLAQVLAEASRVQRAAEAVSIVATAGYTRREEHETSESSDVVESIRSLGFVHEWAPREIGHLLRLSSRTAGSRADFAAGLTARMPRTLEAVRDGAIEAWQASRALDFLADVDDETAREVDAYLGPRLSTTDPTRILALVRYALGRIRPDLLPDTARKAREKRSLDVWEVEPGLSEIIARIPSEKAAALMAAAKTS